jgi:hypothetical protein
MKKIFTLLLVIVISAGAFSQAPQKISYQAIVRNASNALVTNSNIGMQVSILQGSSTGIAFFVERHFPTTNANGLVTVEIGTGVLVSGNFTTIDWSAGPYYLKTETDLNGGANYTISGTTQILSVPYALFAKKAETATESDPIFMVHPAYGITGSNISNWNTAYGWGNHASASYVSNTRSLTINGTTSDLSANRTWNVGTVTSVGLNLPAIFTVSGSPVTLSGMLSASLASQAQNLIFASPDGNSGPPVFRALSAVDIPLLDWGKIATGKPTTISGYGITNAVIITGDQNIAGNKNFTNTITVIAPVNGTDAANKVYIDNLISALQTIINQLTSGKTLCGGKYVDLNWDALNCASCGNVCPIGTFCINGICKCPAGHTNCSNRCVDLYVDNANCGTCGRMCATGYQCTNGNCVAN